MCKSYKFSCFKYRVVPWENLMGIDNYFYMGKMNHNIFDAYLYLLAGLWHESQQMNETFSEFYQHQHTIPQTQKIYVRKSKIKYFSPIHSIPPKSVIRKQQNRSIFHLICGRCPRTKPSTDQWPRTRSAQGGNRLSELFLNSKDPLNSQVDPMTVLLASQYHAMYVFYSVNHHILCLY